MGEHWTEKMFIEHGDLFLKLLQRADKRASKEVEVLEKIFSEMDVHVGDKVLDLCCGHGRHALRLAEKGFNVTGIDISPIAIKHAEELAESMKVKDRVEFLIGDARKVLKLLKKKKSLFNASLSMWTSMGYYDIETDRSILKQLNKLTSSAGVLVVQMTNRDFIVKHFQSFDINNFEDYELHEHRTMNFENSRMESTWKFYKKNGETLKHLATVPVNHRTYSLHELVELLKSSGWEYVDSYGNLEMQPVTPDTNMITIIGKKDV